jgi:hypothetical protein
VVVVVSVVIADDVTVVVGHVSHITGHSSRASASRGVVSSQSLNLNTPFVPHLLLGSGLPLHSVPLL